MKVVFTAHAVSRLRQILAFIANDSPANAVSMVERIIARAETLDTQSFRGRRVPEYQQDNVREIGEPPYRIIYRVTADVVQVLTIGLRRYRQRDPFRRPRAFTSQNATLKRELEYQLGSPRFDVDSLKALGVRLCAWCESLPTSSRRFGLSVVVTKSACCEIDLAAANDYVARHGSFAELAREHYAATKHLT